MKMNLTKFFPVSFMTLLLLIPTPAKAESFNEIALPTGSFVNFESRDPELFNFPPVRAVLSQEEAEAFLLKLGMSAKEKMKPSKWDPFKAARIFQTSA